MIDEKNKCSYRSYLFYGMMLLRIGLLSIVLRTVLRWMILSKVAVGVLKDYQKQKAAGKNPVFKAASIGLRDEDVEYWK